MFCQAYVYIVAVVVFISWRNQIIKFFDESNNRKQCWREGYVGRERSIENSAKHLLNLQHCIYIIYEFWHALVGIMKETLYLSVRTISFAGLEQLDKGIGQRPTS